MSLDLNPEAYRKLLEEDLKWLLQQPRTLERDHIEQAIAWEMKNAERILQIVRENDEYRWNVA